jgi:hypothetical protein
MRKKTAPKTEGQSPAIPLPDLQESPLQGAVFLTEDRAEDPKPTRVSFALTPDGAIDLSSLRQQTKDRLVEAVSKTSLLSAKTSDKSGSANSWGLPDCEHAYRILGEIEAWMLGNEAWRFSEDEIRELKEPTTEWLNLHAAGMSGPGMRLAMAFVGVHLKKYIALKAVLALQRFTTQDKSATPNGSVLTDVSVNEPGGTAEPGSEAWQIHKSR